MDLPSHITLQGMMQHWQSSPHQHGLVTGGLMSPVAVKPMAPVLAPARFVTDAVEVEVAEEEAVAPVGMDVDGMVLWCC